MQEKNQNVILSNLWQWDQSQIISLILTVIIILVVSLIVFAKVTKVKPNQAPTGVALVAEMYVTMVDDNSYNGTSGNFAKARPYLFTLITFLTVGNMISFFGLDPIATSYSVPLTLAIATWIGIFTVGIMYKKWSYLKEFVNPLDFVGKIPPVISLGFRMYGNITGGGTVVVLMYLIFGHLWTLVFKNSEWFFFGSLITPLFHFYFDVFDSLLQGYVFLTLTMVYWLNESGLDDVSTSQEEKQKLTFKEKMTKMLTFSKKEKASQAIY
ncbi:F0F1 ATP synthase subunit A [Mycoplasmopsis synoviae]|uniref:F0F1 ATP synthase subunit A n=1 Tax=Mycoplasmopsis synoviae TaxID=2109 RepID=UPI00356AED61